MSFCFAIIFNFLTSSICHSVDIAKMIPDLFFGSKATIKCLNEIHGVDKIEIEGLSFDAALLTNLHMFCPFFYSGANSKFSDLSSFLTAMNEPCVDSRDTTSNNGSNTSSKDSSTGYIELNDFIIILSGFVFGYVVMSIVMYFIFTQQCLYNLYKSVNTDSCFLYKSFFY